MKDIELDSVKGLGSGGISRKNLLDNIHHYIARKEVVSKTQMIWVAAAAIALLALNLAASNVVFTQEESSREMISMEISSDYNFYQNEVE